MSPLIFDPFTFWPIGRGRIGGNPHIQGNPGPVSSVQERKIEMNEPRRDPTSMVAYVPAGLLVLYVLIRLMT
jgi:hypothetical protein